MDADRWTIVDDLFHQCLNLDNDSQQQLLADVGKDDPELASIVAEMLANHSKSQDFLESSAHEWTNIEIGQSIGPWSVIREIGQGGMSTVYLAERNDGRFNKLVAIKFLHGFIHGAKMHDRLVAEQRILARLNHPNIAQLIDAGLTDSGRPYFILEFIDGTNIIEWCNRGNLSLDQRLDLFDQVAAAVQYAHQHLIVHRDLKPSNILVDRSGNVKLLDFGIAKIVDEESIVDGPATKTGLYMMTPEYASPEQLKGSEITTSSDVYSLGIILFEMITGRHPYPSVPGNPLEYTRQRLESNPSKPSTLVTSTSRSSDEKGIGLHPDYIRELRKRLQGDLDTIVLTALHADVQRRYKSIEQFRSDINNYRSNKPISARPDSTYYRIGKFISRHKVGVALSTVAMLLLAATALVAVLQAQDARLEKEKAEMVTTFLKEMLQSPNPYNDGREVLMVDVIEQAALKMDTSFIKYPEVSASLRQTFGVTYRELGKYDEALGHLSESLNSLIALHGYQHENVSIAQSNLALLHQRLGNYSTADSLFSQAFNTDLKLFGKESAIYAKRLNDLGISKWYLGDYEQAEPLIRESVELEEKLKGSSHTDVAVGLGNLATLLSDKGEYVEALELHKRELHILRDNHPNDTHPAIPQSLSHIGILYSDLGQYETSRQFHAEALSLYRKIRGDDHADVAYALNNLAATYSNLAKPDSSISLLNESLIISVTVLGAQHPNVGIQLNNIARAKRDMGDLAGAEQGYRDALDIWLAAFTEDHPYHAHGYSNLGTVVVSQNRYREALPMLEEAFRIRKQLLPAANPELANTRSILGYCLFKLGRSSEAEPMLKDAYDVLKASLGEDHNSTKAAKTRLDEFYDNRGRPASAG
jgi:eukaryotic-like serine/threonine-protein kinase